jgi:hypothetical protein
MSFFARKARCTAAMVLSSTRKTVFLAAFLSDLFDFRLEYMITAVPI